MKASQVLREYEQGRRDFKRVNLRGQSFVKQELSGADFSEADIRGANFSRAKLTGTNFAGATAGLQRRWVVVQWLLALVMSGLSGILAAFPGWFAVAMIQSGGNLPEKLALGIPFAIVLIATFFAIVRQGFTVQAVSSIAVAVAFAGAFAGAFAVAGAVAGAFAGAFAVTFAVVVAGAFTVTFAGAFIVAVAVAVAVAGAFTVAGAGAFAVILLSLYVAWRAMKGDEKFAIVRQFAVAFGSLGGTRFYRATLTDANFTAATLKSCNFRDATLLRTCWKNAKKLDRARPGNTLLAQSAVLALLITGNGYGKSYIGANLNGANLVGANLERANLKRADLSQATLHQANLKDANLTETLAIGTDFSAAYLTGACLEAWNIDSTTQLAGVDCQYVFLLEHPHPQTGSRERRPHDANRVFQPGDFEKLYQKMMNVVQILLRNGIDKEAFKEAFQKLMEEYPDITFDSIQSIERKGKDFLLTVEVPETADKSQVERLFQDAYEAKLAAAKAAGELEAEKRRSQDMKDITLALAANLSSPIHVTQTSNNQPIAESQAMNENNTNPITKNVEVEMTFQKEVTGAAGKVMRDQNVNPKQTLAESAAEIQQLIQILNQSYPPEIPPKTQEVIDVAVKEIDKNPALKERVVSALRAGGIEALKELTDNPYVNILIATYEGWRNPG